MNFLELCVKIREKADIPGSGPSAVTSQVGILEKVVGWVSDGWAELQSNENWWLFRMATATTTLTTGTASYLKTALLPSDFGYFWPQSLFLTFSGLAIGKITIIEWDDYTATYLHKPLAIARPTEVAISPTGFLHFNTNPDKDYILNFDYQRIVQILAANSDVPTLSVDFHDVIWRKALISYGEYYGAPEVYQPASLYLQNRMDILGSQFLPKVSFRDNAYYGTT